LRGASADAVRKVHAFLSIGFNQATVWGSLLRNPVKGALVPKRLAEEITFFDRAQARRFIECCYQSDGRIVLHFALETGMRPGEYLALSWDDIDLDNCTARVRRAIAVGQRGGGFTIKDPKTAASKRTIRISAQLRDRLILQRKIVDDMKARLEKRVAAPLILEHMKAKGANYEKRRVSRRLAREALANLAKYDLVFPASNGGPFSRLNLNKREMRETLIAAKLPTAGYSLYSLRHTSITLALAEGADIKAVSERAGHSDIVTTLRTYAHVLPVMTARATELLAEALYE